jgi:hypothetical protein
MRRLRVTLTDDQYEYVKEQGPLFLRDVVQIIMEHPDSLLEKKPWWRW